MIMHCRGNLAQAVADLSAALGVSAAGKCPFVDNRFGTMVD
jgi:hypothetical protein